MRWTPVAVALAPVLLLAGCSSPGPDFTVPQDADPDATIRPAGNATEPPEPYVLRIEVRHESPGGPPIAGAAVVFFDASQPAETEGARTGPDGVVVARFYIGGTVSVAAGGVEGYTVEEMPDVVLGDPGEEAWLVLALFEEVRTVEVTGGFPPAVGTPVASASHGVPLAFSPDAAVDREYLARLDGLQATLAWSNGPTGSADLFAGVRSADGEARFDGEDHRQTPADTHNEEPLDVPPQTAQEIGEAAVAGGGLELRAQSRSPVLAAGDLPFTFNVIATFKGSDVTIR